MLVRFAVEGKVRDKAVESIVAEFTKRLSPFFQVELLELGKPNSKQLEQLYKSSKGEEVFIAMDILGKKFTSEKFAEWFDIKRTNYKSVTFLIGEAEGLSEVAKACVNEYISLSDMTLSYRVSLVVLSEQIYRAMTIITGHPYHK